MRVLRNCAFIALLVGLMVSTGTPTIASSNDSCTTSCPADTSSCCNVRVVDPFYCGSDGEHIGWCGYCNNSAGSQTNTECSVELPYIGTVYGTICQCESSNPPGR